jgi:SAM-dependent methyltransferase
MQFAAYSQYYDLLYQDKDYVGEAEYVLRLLGHYRKGCTSVLELGCGTGLHASLLASAGLQVIGVEISETMFLQSLDRAAQVNAKAGLGSFSAMPGDARTIRIDQHVDAVISLFHVVSYQTTNNDVLQMFETAAIHLRHDGIFIFDVWYGPAVVTTRPAVRVKRMASDSIAVLRVAEPELDMNLNRVDVDYTVLVTDKVSGAVETFGERHSMRYFFRPELELIAKVSGFDIIHSEEWLTGNRPSENTWGVTFVARKKGLSAES